ncbi:putative GNAT family acetyltransferase [Actinoplanes octamycinicus]|uniref:Putative GNAT family acetyltransferase n=1 Tax=Actinoplanes octamycinicus TaxID=135948 RepID=A0A7W7M6H6_9ACTN|nr:GNAT family N-acetyltransferase [Actinoplanes octamycinicus]MBB4738798.1 putative GNAT family acetyltransferase [Actinoplanes octamycinicus]GIE63800.1 N-acetyltransferase [Actinoplanes octamycinicus]
MEFAVTDVPEKGRFEARDESGALAGVLTYQMTGPIVVYTHTEVDPAFEGQGAGSALAAAAMDDARAKSRTVVPMCPFVAEWLDKHPAYESLVARNTRRVK